MDVYCKSRNIKQATKRSLVRMDQRNLQDALYRYLATYRNTVSNVTNQTPSFMVFGREVRSVFDIEVRSVFGRKVRSVFDLIKPTTRASASQKADIEKSQNNARTIFREGEEVWAYKRRFGLENLIRIFCGARQKIVRKKR